MPPLDVTALLSAVSRTVRTTERDGKPARVIAVARVFDTDIDDAWEALTLPDRVNRWFTPVTGDLRRGGRFQLQGNAAGTITACEPPRYFASTWEFAGETSWIDVRLDAQSDARTRLLLEHTALIKEPDEFWDQFGPGAVGVGWELGVLGLYLHLLDRAAAVREEGEAWAMSDDGKQFIAKVSDAWGEASIAGGTVAEHARAAAERTTAFYTGAAPSPHGNAADDDAKGDGS